MAIMPSPIRIGKSVIFVYTVLFLIGFVILGKFHVKSLEIVRLRRAMDYFSEHWGDLASAAGLIFALIGLAWAAIQSGKASSSAEAAKEAANETRGIIDGHLLIVDLQRSINLIQHIKTLHRRGSWEVSLELYQELREMIAAIIVRYSEDAPELLGRLSKARASIIIMEREVESLNARGLRLDVSELNQTLNIVQSDLENMAATTALYSEHKGQT